MSNHNGCHDMLGNLSDYLDKEASAALCAEIDKHLADCENCRVVVDTLSHTIMLYRTLPQPEIPESVRERLYKTLDLEPFFRLKDQPISHFAPSLGMTVRLKADFEAAQQRAIDALKAEGFGILTEIDARQTLKNKLDVDFHPYKILGACNPPLAYRALTATPEAGLLLPCNVVVAFVDDQATDVSLVDPMSMLGILNQPELEPMAAEARTRLERVIAALQKE
jgi:uncharacterized protein (DUF302 family)